ncbi:hypothetical protein [Streptococcus sp.]|uniref:hypothetical protein n=1 Tax=Streptococcus sp. TaxID=1306 RepID=UPI0026DD8490|nr:hypothetical protein [Streptococcus sp.]MDO4658873.1 hypothetical protein [Streptococcus sp.]
MAGFLFLIKLFWRTVEYCSPFFIFWRENDKRITIITLYCHFISFLVREMGIDIVEAISLMAELEKSGLILLESSGDLILKELGGAL